MAMKIKNSELIMVDRALAYLSGENTKAWYPIARNIQKIAQPLKDLEEAQKGVYEKLCDKNEDGSVKPKKLDNGNEVMTFEDNAEELEKVMFELLEEEVDVDFYRFSYEKFGDCQLDSIKIQPLMDKVIHEEA
jgi:hypothetical protein